MALAGGFGFFFVEFDVAGLAPLRECFATGDEVKRKPGAFLGFGGKIRI